MRLLLDFAKGKPRPGNMMQVAAPELQDAQLAAAYYPHRIGGDCYEFLRVSRNRTLFMLLDIAGRIDQTRPIVAAVQQVFGSAARELFASDEMNEADAMIELCLRLNRAILDTAGRVCSSPAFAGCYNESLGTVTYLNAGHTPGLLRDGDRIIELGATGLPLGLFTHAPPDASIVALEPGDTLAIVSRGIVEAKRRRQEFGLDQVRHSLLRLAQKSASETCSAVLEEVVKFTGTAALTNDATIVALTRDAATKAARTAG